MKLLKALWANDLFQGLTYTALFFGLLFVVGCGDTPILQPKPRNFGIEIDVKKYNQDFRSLTLRFNDCSTAPGNVAPYFETNNSEEIANIIRALEKTVAELKSIDEQIKVTKPVTQDPPLQ